jgi:hypothetical protein
MGLPVQFDGVIVDGEPAEEGLYLQAGIFVQSIDG